LDLGLEEARKFIDKFIYPSVEDILKNDSVKDYKTLIQELAQANFNVTPVYEVLNDE
jgi:dsRNA-specific ribonuclease